VQTLKLLLAGLALSGACATTTAFAADGPRLALWITEPIGATSGSQCDLARIPLPGVPFPLPETPPTLTERDVNAWDSTTARWTLNPARFAASDAGQKLEDHCFVLALDGKPASSGIVLSSHSARLTGLPTITAIRKDNTLVLELLSSYHGSSMRHLHVEALDSVLGQPANLERQLERIGATGTPMANDLQGLGNAWIAAVRSLVERNEIRQGMPVAEVIKRLGAPSRVTATADGQRTTHYLWYFATPLHVNPAFDVYAEDEIVRSHSFGRR
jgi:hypothetical protein